MPYEYLDELAVTDAAFRAWGPDLSETFRSAADAMLEVMVSDPRSVEARERRQIDLSDERADMLLFALLQELIFYKDAEQLLLRVPDIVVETSDGRCTLRATAVGERLDPTRHEQGADVKAVTLHQLKVERTADGWEARVILDV